MFMSMLFLSLWPSIPQPRRGGTASSTSSTMTVAAFLPGVQKMAECRQEALLNAESLAEGQVKLLAAKLDVSERARSQLLAEKGFLDGRVQQLESSLDANARERSQQLARIETFIVERARFEKQIGQLQSEFLEVQQAAERAKAGGMGRRSSSTTSTASPPSSPTQEMVPKTQLELSQSLAHRMEELLGAAEGERDLLQKRAAALEAQLAVPSVEAQKKEWAEKIKDLQCLMRALEKVKPPPVPGLDLSALSRRVSVVEPLHASFKGNGSFSRVRQGSFLRRHSPQRLRGEPIVAKREAGTSPLQEEHVLSRDGSPQEQSLTSFPLFQAFEEEGDRWVELEQWRKVYGELKRYVDKIGASESSDDDVFTQSAVSAVAASESEIVKKLRAELTAKSQVEVSLDAANKELARLRVGIVALLKATELTSSDLVYAKKEGVALETVTLSKPIPMREQLDVLLTHPALQGIKFGRSRDGALVVTAFPLLDELQKNHKRRLVKGAPGAPVQVEKISGGWCC